MKITCIQCGKEFELSDNEINFYKNKNFELPKRCKECRQKNKRNALVQSTVKNNYDGISKRYNKITTGYTNKSKHRSCIMTGIIILFILLFAGGNYAGQFLHDSRDSENPVESHKDINDQRTEYQYLFRNDEYLAEHFGKHGSEFGYTTKEDYLKGANKVIASSDSLHKQEAEDGDELYFMESTGEFVIVSTDGYIRTYFKPEDGIEYFNRQ